MILHAQGHEPISVAMLIGISASKMGSRDVLFSRTLCLHMPSLLPAVPTSSNSLVSELEISPMIQAAAFAGFGLLYVESCNRQIIEFLLSEMYRPANTNRLECLECIHLAASWALGMVILGKGCNYAVPSDCNMSRGSEELFPIGHPRAMGTLDPKQLNGIWDLKLEDRLLGLINGGVLPGVKGGTRLPTSTNDNGTKASR